MESDLFTICVIALLHVIPVRTVSTDGAISLDSLTFNKILAKHSKLLVKFDESFAYGEKQDVFVELANKSGKVPELIIGEVQTSDYGSMKNQDMEKRFNIQKSDRPAYCLFKDHSPKPIKYSGSITIAGLSNFLYEHVDVRLPLAHCMPKFDAFVVRFMKEADEEGRREIIEEAVRARGKLKTEWRKTSADTYVKLMEKVLEKGDGFPAAETKRIEKVVQKGGQSMSDKKKESFTARLNILAAFKTFDKDVKKTDKEEL